MDPIGWWPQVRSAALSLLLYGLAHEPFAALSASLLAGLSWICVLSTLNVSVQVALPEWARARGLAVFVVFFFGALTIGSAFWGYLAGVIGLSATNFVAAGGILVALPLTWRWKLLTALGADLAPTANSSSRRSIGLSRNAGVTAPTLGVCSRRLPKGAV